MPGILRRQAFPGENMAQVAAAIRANDLGSGAIGIHLVRNGAFYLIIKTWPAAAGFEFID